MTGPAHTVQFCALVSLLFISRCYGLFSGDGYRRNVSMELNPGLNGSVAPPPGVGLIHVRAVGSGDTLHVLLSNLGAPALLLAHTNSSSSSLRVDWPAFLSGQASGSVKVEPEGSVQFSGAAVFTRLWEYDDANDTADPEHQPASSFFPPYELQNFSWEDLNKSVNVAEHTATLCGADRSDTFTNGSFCLAFAAFESEGRGQAWPKLLHSANSSQIQMWLEGVTPRSNHSRFALELQAVSSGELRQKVDVIKSIDDEYTPSIFKLSQWASSPTNTSSRVLGYTQWKPVAYLKANPVTEDSTPCRNSEPTPQGQLPPSGLVKAFFTEEYKASGLNMSFGISGNPFYGTSEYLSWTVLLGVGSPPLESFSPLVIAIMAVGLGTPLVLILFGGIYICIRKATHQPDGYRPIN
ncbi:glycosylated lysosomal membrane protein [Denticeps clupeoides]|uniref:Glycosylated lysosomal membrane protein n=1 Tax=Denticeps clupeoides TaxID=299321 RepID=A0AAY4D4W7_9TELE|nr:glycosylated lysosomal membrane protein [Denticeps clupeoides]